MKTLTPQQIAWAHEYVTAGDSFKVAASKLAHRRGKRIHEYTLRRHYWYAMEHGFAAWYA